METFIITHNKFLADERNEKEEKKEMEEKEKKLRQVQRQRRLQQSFIITLSIIKNERNGEWIQPLKQQRENVRNDGS